MARRYSTTITANGVDMGKSVGFVVERVSGWPDAGANRVDSIALPGGRGRLVTRIEADQAKTLTVAGTVLGASLTERNSLQDRLKRLLGSGAIRVRRVDHADRTAIGYRTGAIVITDVAPSMRRSECRVSFDVLVPSGVIEDTVPLPYGFGSTPTAMPLGNWPVKPLIRWRGPGGGSGVTFVARTAAGVPFSTFTLTGTFASTDWFEIDCSTYRIQKIASGTRTAAYSAYSGDNLPVLDPADGDAPASSWPTLECDAGTATAIYARTW